MGTATRRVHLSFPAEHIKDPVIYNLGMDFGVVTNIRRASIEEDFGWVVLEVTGEASAIEAGFAYLEKLGIQVDPIEGDIVEG